MIVGTATTPADGVVPGIAPSAPAQSGYEQHGRDG